MSPNDQPPGCLHAQCCHYAPPAGNDSQPRLPREAVERGRTGTEDHCRTPPKTNGNGALRGTTFLDAVGIPPANHQDQLVGPEWSREWPPGRWWFGRHLTDTLLFVFFHGNGNLYQSLTDHLVNDFLNRREPRRDRHWSSPPRLQKAKDSPRHIDRLSKGGIRKDWPQLGIPCTKIGLSFWLRRIPLLDLQGMVHNGSRTIQERRSPAFIESLSPLHPRGQSHPPSTGNESASIVEPTGLTSDPQNKGLIQLDLGEKGRTDSMRTEMDRNVGDVALLVTLISWLPLVVSIGWHRPEAILSGRSSIVIEDERVIPEHAWQSLGKNDTITPLAVAVES
ncbi:hypothetical protein BGZ61DRAFT_487005 [Ilyonectria robusta]|uniref:uncharacterized protein n=1 Tax=Ilyonectria robusta TaxID=1079257 RepID=UPI001E8CE992|nr:uncharacterized protein BGZ61DRAFT_487005 [Ilyonectria robusta]KAH8654693.1 hypothetical protein BGZ61DRAFT_487005 [Ilyonectria robusta]